VARISMRCVSHASLVAGEVNSGVFTARSHRSALVMGTGDWAGSIVVERVRAREIEKILRSGMTQHASKVADRRTGESHGLTFWGDRPFCGMALPKPSERVTPQEYYARERLADHKSEYYEGEILAMAGGTARHSRIGTNLTIRLGMRLEGGRCVPYNSDLRVKVQPTSLRTYPDASVFCGKIEFDPDDRWKETATNPTMLFEVLSDSTEAYDRGAKSEQYRRIASLKAYVLINQGTAHVEHFEREADGTWRLTEATGLEEVLKLPALGAEIPLAELYAGVEFDELPQLNVVREG
jgi:Uma2 family endonuclease